MYLSVSIDLNMLCWFLGFNSRLGKEGPTAAKDDEPTERDTEQL